MYNRYIPNGTVYARVVEDDGPSRAAPSPAPHVPENADPAVAAAEKKSGLAGILKGLKLDDLDTGDILLLLILLFLFLEGDDMELIITLGLMLLLGLD